MHASIEVPSTWVTRFAPLMPRGEVLDLACGAGRHARHFAALGYRVLAVDRDAAALEKVAGNGIATMRLDLESDDASASAWPFPAQRFAGVVVTNYLSRPLFPRILESIALDGMLIYETFAQGNEHFGRPSNPAFLLAPGELLDILRDAKQDWRVIAFEDGYVNLPKPAMMQRVCAVKGNSAASGLRLD